MTLSSGHGEALIICNWALSALRCDFLSALGVVPCQRFGVVGQQGKQGLAVEPKTTKQRAPRVRALLRCAQSSFLQHAPRMPVGRPAAYNTPVCPHPNRCAGVRVPRRQKLRVMMALPSPPQEERSRGGLGPPGGTYGAGAAAPPKPAPARLATLAHLPLPRPLPLPGRCS